MAIRYSGGTIHHDQIDGTSRTSILDGIKATLLACGWSQVGAPGAYIVATFAGNPTNAQTRVFDGVTYRMVTTLAQAYDIKIGATKEETAQNFCDAVNEEAATKGTAYHSDTVAHPTLAASMDATNKVRLTYKTGGTSGNGWTTSGTWTNVTVDSSTGRYGGWTVNSAKSPHGLQFRLLLDDDLTYANIRVASHDQSVISQRYLLAPATERIYEALACRYQIFVFLLGTSSTNTSDFEAGIPYIRDAHAPSIIQLVGDDGEGQYLVTTKNPHGLASGAHVFIDGAEGVTGLNGRWEITVMGASTYVLKASTYQEGYVSESANSAGPTAISRAIWSMGQTEAAFCRRTLRQISNSMAGTGHDTRCWFAFNQYAWGLTSGAGTVWSLIFPARPMGSTVASSFMMRNWGSYYDLHEARIAWPPTAVTGGHFIIGELWNAFCVNDLVEIDILLDNFDGHNWIQFINGNFTASGVQPVGSLWLARTKMA